MLKCDYCGYVVSTSASEYKAGDNCPKCKKGILCAKGSIGFNKGINK